MKEDRVKIEWPNGVFSIANVGGDWLAEANKAGISIPTGCLTGSCGACEIEVNGKVVRACISNIPKSNKLLHKVSFSYDPYW
ncbi:2Fe-2S iron-sulfur cluster-binding protein [Prochlorococcus marinus]|uniref:2Fe-2S iron-sulfur cluster-binding protein n=1 Tax=Prochlorococcus marinus TaxID=1219 RepID=UPI0022B310C1|nr:2Fe-2S iron-sulfur cluster-binding protein [Prochlorococcus marinus]